MPLKIVAAAPGGISVTLEVNEREAYAELAALALDRVWPHAASQSTNGNTKGQTGRMAPAPQTPPASVAEGEDAFRAFCQAQDPMGDMRRLVVAAEGAHRFLAMNHVSAKELGPLFDRAGWPHPKDFVQTLRNAARSSFRWLERVPGREGYYKVSDRGRATVLKQA